MNHSVLQKFKDKCGKYPEDFFGDMEKQESCHLDQSELIIFKMDGWKRPFIYSSDGEHFFMTTEAPNSFSINEAGTILTR